MAKQGGGGNLLSRKKGEHLRCLFTSCVHVCLNVLAAVSLTFNFSLIPFRFLNNKKENEREIFFLIFYYHLCSSLSTRTRTVFT